MFLSIPAGPAPALAQQPPSHPPSTAVTHYFKMDKARADLGYDPRPSDLVKCGALDWFLEHHPHMRSTPSQRRRVLLALGLLAIIIALVTAKALGSVV